MGAAFARLFYFVNHVMTNELESVLGRLIFQFVMGENQNNQRTVVG